MRLVVASVALLLAGCANQTGRTHVRIANLGSGLQTSHIPIDLAQALGFYKDEGLDVTVEDLPSLGKTMEALLGNSVDVAGVTYPQVIQLEVQGKHVRTFFVTTRRDSKVLVVTPAASGRVRRAEDLKGAVIGIPSPGSPTNIWVNYYLGLHGVTPAGFSTASIGVGPTALAAIESGRIDAAGLAGGDHIRLLKKHPELRVLADDSTPEGMRETYGDGDYAGGALGAKREWLERNPDTARRLARALLRTLEWMQAHTPEEIRARLPESFLSQDAPVDCEIIRWGRAGYSTDGRMHAGAPEAARHYLDATIEEVRESRIDLAATWTNEFVPEVK